MVTGGVVLEHATCGAAEVRRGAAAAAVQCSAWCAHVLHARWHRPTSLARCRVVVCAATRRLPPPHLHPRNPLPAGAPQRRGAAPSARGPITA